jgi:nitrite reductase (NADH) small subunit
MSAHERAGVALDAVSGMENSLLTRAGADLGAFEEVGMQRGEKAVATEDGWIEVGKLAEIPRQGARVVRTRDGDIAVFRTLDDEVFALRDKCPHKGGPLSQGIVHGRRVACPLHDWKVHLDSGQAVAPDEGCAATFPVRSEGGVIWLYLHPDAGCPNS